MPRVRFDGRGRLHVYGYELRTGDSAVLSDERAAALVANPRVQVTVIEDKHQPEAEDGEGQHTDPKPEEEE